MRNKIERSSGVGLGASNRARRVEPLGSPTLAPTRRPLGAVITSAIDAGRTLVRKHIELARIEMKEALSARAKGAGLMVGAAILGLFALGFAAASGSAALDLVLPAWAAHLIVSGGFVVIAGALVLAGRRDMRRAPKPRAQMKQRVKEEAKWARQRLTR